MQHFGHLDRPVRSDLRRPLRQIVVVGDLLLVTRQGQLEKGFDKIVDLHVGIGVKADVDPVLDGPDRLLAGISGG